MQTGMSKAWLGLALAALAGACGDDGKASDTSDTSADTAAEADTAPVRQVTVGSCNGLTPVATISTAGMAFAPSEVTINAGETVKFTPTSNHNMTAGAPGAKTGEFATATSQEACLTFDDAGEYPFFCSVHPTMTGTVQVN